MRALEFITGHVIYNPAYTYKFQLKTTMFRQASSKVYKKDSFIYLPSIGWLYHEVVSGMFW